MDLFKLTKIKNNKLVIMGNNVFFFFLNHLKWATACQFAVNFSMMLLNCELKVLCHQY